MNTKTHPDRVLAVAPTTRGFAYVVFESALAPFDWGSHGISGPRKNAKFLQRLEAIIERCHPQVIVLQDTMRRRARIRTLSLAIRHMAASAQIDVHIYHRAAIRRCFAPAGARTKVEIAHAIARMIPALSHRLPPTRKIWMSEDRRQSLFDAAALGLAYYEDVENNQDTPDKSKQRSGDFSVRNSILPSSSG